MMNSTRVLFIIVVVVSLFLVVGNLVRPVNAHNPEIFAQVATNGTPTAQANNQDMIVSAVPGEIKGVIQSYFETRYHAFSTLQLPDFKDLVSVQPDAVDFLELELGKLEIELEHHRDYRLGWTDYESFLRYRNVSFDDNGRIVRVNVTEGFNVIYEISREFNQANPVVSKVRNIEHTITLHREDGQWKIVSDVYVDYLWKALKEIGVSPEKFLSVMETPRDVTLKSPSALTEFHCDNLPALAPTHVYDREDAVNYAYEYYNNYNPNYDDFSGIETWGDCTNFVSQAIYEGGNASMAYPEEQGVGTVGWYYTDMNHRATAWTHVGKIYEFITDPSNTWSEGPEGCELSEDQENLAEPGDLIQYDKQDDGEWDHTVMINRVEDDGQGNRMYYVTGHSDDMYDEPYTFLEEQYPNYVSRFVHVEWIDISNSRGFNTDGILASYYNDEDDGQWVIEGPITWDTFTPPVVVSRLEPYIAFDTGTESPAPGVNGTFWSAIWEGTIHTAQDGNYIFRFKNLDDGARLYVDDMNTPLLESWKVQGFHNYQTDPIALTAGLHDFRVEFAQGPGFGGGLIVEWDLENVFREKIGPYSDATPPPTSTPTFTPSPTPVPTDTPVPSDTPMPTDTPVPTNTPDSEPTSPPPWWAPAENVLMQDEPAEKRDAFSELLSQVRDQVLKSSPKGDAYIEMIYQHAPEIMKLLMQDEDLRQQVKNLALEVQPLLESTVYNGAKGEGLSLEKSWVDEAVKILAIVEKQASPELREEIRWWQTYLPDFAGKTGKEIWEMLPER